MLDRTHPEFLRDLQERLEARAAEFRAGTISEDVFGAYLFGMGFRGARLREEINFRRAEQ